MSVLIPDEIPEVLKKTNGYSLLIKGPPGMGKSTFALTLMVEKANDLKARLGVDNARFVHGNGVDLRFLDDASLDFAFSYVVLIHVPGPEIIKGYIREMTRVVRPGGTLFFQLPTYPPGVAHLPHILRHVAIRRASRLLSAFIGPAKMGMNSPAYHGSRMTLQGLMRAFDPEKLDVPFIRVGPLNPEYTGPSTWDRAYHTWVLATRK